MTIDELRRRNERQQRALDARNIACARALGMLESLLRAGNIPEHHRAQASGIVAEYRVALAQFDSVDAEVQA